MSTSLFIRLSSLPSRSYVARLSTSHPSADHSQDPSPYWWGGYDTVPDLLFHAAAFSGMTYLAGSLCLRFSNRIRWGTVSPNFRQRRMVLALASGLYGTRLGLRFRTEDVSDAIADVPFLAAPCLNLVYYPWMLSIGEDEELTKKVDQMRNEYKDVRKEQGMPDVVTEAPDNEGSCSAWCAVCLGANHPG